MKLQELEIGQKFILCRNVRKYKLVRRLGVDHRVKPVKKMPRSADCRIHCNEWPLVFNGQCKVEVI